MGRSFFFGRTGSLKGTGFVGSLKTPQAVSKRVLGARARRLGTLEKPRATHAVTRRRATALRAIGWAAGMVLCAVVSPAAREALDDEVGFIWPPA